MDTKQCNHQRPVVDNPWRAAQLLIEVAHALNKIPNTEYFTYNGNKRDTYTLVSEIQKFLNGR